MDHAARDQVLDLGGVGGHVRRGGVRLQRVQRLPLLDDDERVGAELRLERCPALGIDRGAVLDAALLGVHGGHVGAEGCQDGVALAGLGGDDGDDVDHDRLGLLLAFRIRA